MRKFLLAALLLLCSFTAHAECYPAATNSSGVAPTFDCVYVNGYLNSTGQAVPYSNALGDPCQNPYNTVNGSAAINVSTATTTAIIGSVAGKVIYVCSLYFTTAGT